MALFWSRAFIFDWTSPVCSDTGQPSPHLAAILQSLLSRFPGTCRSCVVMCDISHVSLIPSLDVTVGHKRKC